MIALSTSTITAVIQRAPVFRSGFTIGIRAIIGKIAVLIIIIDSRISDITLECIAIIPS
ncbi:hypothetical protein HPG81_11440 [Salmonella enterica subsp. VII serovar 1,40:g,z51:--]|nr:hypothetical protein [Salmonella enterica subsp. VII str. CFSAN000550]EDU6367277.1 hypothetical protein [Salmonella enterica subsp. houtenae serovar 40:z4,z24:-]EDU7899170.1 hypothetical protein [Salmonella enterica subsp. houtenae]EEO7412030.1 hypothetical protein [Salmonella enterica]QJY67069.1 hypothetical protein HPG81_11440 [Salmonella enterica subsp. VII serovar 1,40:g,z51:--]